MEVYYRFRIYPNKEQEQLIQKTFGCCRFVYNYYLVKRENLFKETGKTMSYFESTTDLTKIKKEYEWLCEVDVSALRSALKNLDNAFKFFFQRVQRQKKKRRYEKFGYPKFKKKKDRKNSYTSKYSHGNIRVFEKHVQIPKLGKIKCKVSKSVVGRILNATISQSKSGKYFVSICCTDFEPTQLEKTGNAVGIDLGLKTYITMSDGCKIDNPRFLKKSFKKISLVDRKLHRKTMGSNRREKARIKCARVYEKVANQRKDWLQKLSTSIIKGYDIICIEDLSIKFMSKMRNLSRSIYDASWNYFVNCIYYKSNWYGKTVSKISHFYPSSKLCSECGCRFVGKFSMDTRKWTCSNCGATHDRDINAAKNILTEGIRLLG